MTTDVWWVQISPLLIALGVGVGAVVVDAWSRRVIALVLVVAGLLFSAGLCLYLYFHGFSDLLAGVLVVGRGIYGVWAALFVLSAFALAGGYEFVRRHPSGGGVAALVAFTAVGSAALAASIDLLLTLLMLETVAVAGYGLVASVRTSASQEASLKYIIQGGVATGLFLLGLAIAMSLLAGSAGLAQIGSGARALTLPATAAAILLVSALAFKLGAFPFHSWVPDSYGFAPPMAAALLAAVPKLGALSAMFLIAEVMMRPLVGSSAPAMQPTMVFVALAAASIIFGNLGALRQERFGRMLGYSGIAQAGYALIGPAVGFITYSGAMLLMATYGLAAGTAFLAAESLRVEARGWDGTIASMSGLARRRPFLAAALAVAMFSLTGIPLTAGFVGKLLVFGPAAGQGLEWLVVVGVIGSVVSFGYYGAVIRTIYFDPESDDDSSAAQQNSDELLRKDSFAGHGRDHAAVALTLLGAAALIVIGVTPLFTGLTPFVRFFAIGG